MPGGVFQEHHRAVFWAWRQGLEERISNPLQPFDFGTCARVKDDAKETQALRAVELVGQRGERSRAQPRIATGHIDQIVCMRDGRRNA